MKKNHPFPAFKTHTRTHALKKKQREKKMGANNPNWKGGVTQQYIKNRDRDAKSNLSPVSISSWK